MTRNEAETWAKTQAWSFRSYHKYRFTFAASGDGLSALASTGGDSGDIYRFEVEDPMAWAEIRYAGEPYLVTKDADGKVIYEG